MTRTPGTPVLQAQPSVQGGSESPPSFHHPVAPPLPTGRVLIADLNISIDRNGAWYYQGSVISRKELVCLFASVLSRDEEGGYWLVTPAEMGRVHVEEVPFIAVELFSAGAGRSRSISLRTNIDEIVTIDEEHPLTIVTNAVTGEPAPYVTVRAGLEAKLARPVYYELVELGVEEVVQGAHMFGVWSCGHFFPIGNLERSA